ncbi:hypothetical protein PHMEG_0009256 [Phytophthora megakarya]|uniref:Uncharacterized protein n=1 Tax=Phytophthora megakarya TaxID=4795 RepID=A0A225WGN9_9STRA|nr:hypothetical protein PHMEG_0009256 [Phytophthora megakarya]
MWSKWSRDKSHYLPSPDASLVDLWPEMCISHLASIAKVGTSVDICLITDYSIPEGQSVNDVTDRENFPSIRIHGPALSHVGKCILIKLGDVSGAFRYIPVRADSVHMFGFVFENLLVIVLACELGWCGSPAFYSLAGKIINYLYEHDNSLNCPFTGYVWCNDYTCIEIDEGSKCVYAKPSLRRAMATVFSLPPHPSTNTNLRSGLWNAKHWAYSGIPTLRYLFRQKLAKAFTRIQNFLLAATTSRLTLPETLQSLRHVASCFPPARGYKKQLHDVQRTFAAQFRVLHWMTLAGSKLFSKILVGSTVFLSFTSQTPLFRNSTSIWTPVETNRVLLSHR